MVLTPRGSPLSLTLRLPTRRILRFGLQPLGRLEDRLHRRVLPALLLLQDLDRRKAVAADGALASALTLERVEDEAGLRADRAVHSETPGADVWTRLSGRKARQQLFSVHVPSSSLNVVLAMPNAGVTVVHLP